MRWHLPLLLALALSALSPDASYARIYDDEMCWSGDSEFPVPCDGDEARPEVPQDRVTLYPQAP